MRHREGGKNCLGHRVKVLVELQWGSDFHNAVNNWGLNHSIISFDK